jgi:lipoprotein-anchoring transpeptidase ErfK/SrfK
VRQRVFLTALGACVLVVVGLIGGSLLTGAGARDARSAPTAGERHAAGQLSLGLREPPPPRGGSVVANVEGRAAVVYRSPRAPRPWRRYLNPTAQDTPLVFLVRKRAAGWLRVLLPSRPNGAEGWLPERGVSLRADRWSIVVSLGAHLLRVRRAGRTVLSAPVGVGRAATPTPAGLYYITELLRQPSAHGTYGPWAFALSAFSPVLTHFGAGEGQVGLHGTNEPAGIGHTVSHGCIRVRNEVIERLARLLPLGTPVRILAPARHAARRGRSPERNRAPAS